MKRSYKKLKTEEVITDGDKDKYYTLAKHVRRAPSIVRKYVREGEFKNLSDEQLKAMSKMLKSMDQSTWVDYVYFLLNPIKSPRKVKVPGLISNPLGTCVREFKSFVSYASVNTSDIYFIFTPGSYCFNSGDYNTAGSYPGATQFLIAQKTGTASPDVDANYTPTAMPMPWPANTSTFFTDSRLLAAELKVNVIESTLTAQEGS